MSTNTASKRANSDKGHTAKGDTKKRRSIGDNARPHNPIDPHREKLADLERKRAGMKPIDSFQIVGDAQNSVSPNNLVGGIDIEDMDVDKNVAVGADTDMDDERGPKGKTIIDGKDAGASTGPGSTSAPGREEESSGGDVTISRAHIAKLEKYAASGQANLDNINDLMTELKKQLDAERAALKGLEYEQSRARLSQGVIKFHQDAIQQLEDSIKKSKQAEKPFQVDADNARRSIESLLTEITQASEAEAGCKGDMAEVLARLDLK